MLSMDVDHAPAIGVQETEVSCVWTGVRIGGLGETSPNSRATRAETGRAFCGR